MSLGETTIACPACSWEALSIRRINQIRQLLLDAGYRFVERRNAYARDTDVVGLLLWVNPPAEYEQQYRLTPWRSRASVADFPNWLTNRYVKNEAARLRERGLDVEHWLWVGDSWGEDGYCTICLADFRGPGAFCSDSCRVEDQVRRDAEARREFARLVNGAPVCAGACGRKLLSTMAEVREARRLLGADFSYGHFHHTSYTNDTTVLLCTSCHHRVTHEADLPPHLAVLRPEMKLAAHERRRRAKAAKRRAEMVERKAQREAEARDAAEREAQRRAVLSEVSARIRARDRWRPPPRPMARRAVCQGCDHAVNQHPNGGPCIATYGDNACACSAWS